MVEEARQEYDDEAARHMEARGLIKVRTIYYLVHPLYRKRCTYCNS